MRHRWSRLGGGLLMLCVRSVQSISVELSETLELGEASVYGEFTSWFSSNIDAVDDDCQGVLCLGVLTRDGSLDLESKYGCTQPNSLRRGVCGVQYSIATEDETATIAAINIALHPDSIRSIRVYVDDEVVVSEWEGAEGSEMQAIPGVEGSTGSSLLIEGRTEAQDYFALLEVEIFVEVDDVEVKGVSASSRSNVSASSSTDADSAMNTLDGDVSAASTWTCPSGEVCEITYDLGSVQSLEQMRLAFSDDTDASGEISFYAAGVSGVYSEVRTGLEAGGRPTASDGLQTFGGVRAVARYVKVEVTSADEGPIVLSEVELRVAEDAPSRPVDEKPWLKVAGPLPAGRLDNVNYNYASRDVRPTSYGGCESTDIFDGCHIFYAKDGDMSEDSRWSCGPTSTGGLTDAGFTEGLICPVEFALNIYRYVRQIQFAFYLGDERHVEFEVQAYGKDSEWKTVVASAITSGDTTGFQTFNVDVHTNAIRIVPKFKYVTDSIDIIEMVILERRKNAFVEGTVPVFDVSLPYGEESKLSRRFKFDIAEVDEEVDFDLPDFSVVHGLNIRFPASRVFTFEFEGYYRDEDGDEQQYLERFTSAGGSTRVFEYFELAQPIEENDFTIIAIEGPTIEGRPNYPALRVLDFQVVGESIKPSNVFNMVSTAMTTWGEYGVGMMPDLVAEASSDQDLIMTAICETKGAVYDGTDCVGDLDDTSVTIRFPSSRQPIYVNGPIFMKSGTHLVSSWNPEYWIYGGNFYVYDGPNVRATGEDAILVMDGVTDASITDIQIRGWSDGATGDIEAGTVGNLFIDVKNSEDIRFYGMIEFGVARTGALRFTDSRNISTQELWNAEYETGNYMELTRVDDVYIRNPPEMGGLRIDTCSNVVFEGAYDSFETPDPGVWPPAGGEQAANAVITGDSSGIVFKNMAIGPGEEPRILVESADPLTLDLIFDFEEAEEGDCIVQVPEGSTDDSLIQIDLDVTLTKSGDCWVL